jgi:hypothetical protein
LLGLDCSKSCFLSASNYCSFFLSYYSYLVLISVSIFSWASFLFLSYSSFYLILRAFGSISTGFSLSNSVYLTISGSFSTFSFYSFYFCLLCYLCTLSYSSLSNRSLASSSFLLSSSCFLFSASFICSAFSATTLLNSSSSYFNLFSSS